MVDQFNNTDRESIKSHVREQAYLIGSLMTVEFGIHELESYFGRLFPDELNVEIELLKKKLNKVEE